MLDAVPLPNQSAQVDHRDNGSLVIYVPLRQRWFMQPPWSWLLRVRQQAGYELDGLGREVWEACDGKRTVENIIDNFAARHHLRFHEARLSVMAFLQQLVRRGVIVLVGKS
ncbi:MAG: PqqD family protein [Phycisphaerales bacterium]|nr:PqqD family protein [Phycisphaerales bacterium]